MLVDPPGDRNAFIVSCKIERGGVTVDGGVGVEDDDGADERNGVNKLNDDGRVDNIDDCAMRPFNTLPPLPIVLPPVPLLLRNIASESTIEELVAVVVIDVIELVPGVLRPAMSGVTAVVDGWESIGRFEKS